MSLAIILLAAVAATPAPTVDSLRWEKRVVLVSAPQATDPAAVAQRRILARVRGGSDDRDLMLVEALGDKVIGASDTAAALRRNYKLPADRFTVILIGKDGGEKQRSATPMSAASLFGTIDAMPMRRQGRR